MAEKFMHNAAFCRIWTLFVITISLIAAGVFLLLLPGNPDNAVSVPWTIVADFFLPLLFLGCSIRFSSRFCAAAAMATALLAMILRIAGWVICRETLMPLSWTTLSLLAEHTDATALRVFLGKNYLYWLIPSLAAATGLIAFCLVAAWKSDFKEIFRRRLAARIFFAAFLAVSLAGNVGYQRMIRERQGTFYTGTFIRPLLFFGAEVAEKTLRAVISGHRNGAPGYFPGNLDEADKEILRAHGVYHDAQQRDLLQEKTSRFDHIIIIAVESLDLDFIAAVNPVMPRGVTPVFDKLFARCPHLVHCYCGAQPTSWGLNALLSSRLDYRDDLLNYRNESLLSVARKAGFSTAYYSACRGSFGDNRTRYRKMFHFDKLFFMEDWIRMHGKATLSEWGIADRDLFRFVLAELKQHRNEKFCAVISTMDTHPLYHADRSFGDGKENFLNALYSTDRNLGMFLDAIQRDPALYNLRTLIVVTSDHTATHGRNYLNRKQFSPEKVPLVFVTPDAACFRDIPVDRCASSIDVAPTIVHLIGEKIPDTFMGQDLRMPRSAALSRNLDDQLLVRSAGNGLIIDLQAPPPADATARAFYRYYRMFYKK